MEPIVSEIEVVQPDAAEWAMAVPVAKPRQAGQRGASKAGAGKPPARRRVRVAEGIYRDRHGLAATVKVNGVQREVRFPPGTPLKTIRAKRDELRASLRTLPAGGRHTLNHDAGRYLDQVESTLISFAERRREVLAWLPRFGHLRTSALPAHLPMLNAQLHEWRRTLAASTVNHRWHALTNLVRVLYGRRASFDLLDLVRFAPPPPKPRWVDRRHIAAVLAAIPAGSVTRVRLDLMHWTGMRPSQMGRLRAEDFRLDEPIPYVAVPRGKGGRIAAVPLVPEGVAARLPRRRGIRAVAPQQRQPRARRRRAPRREGRVHHLPDPPLVRGGAAPRRDRCGRYPGPLWTYPARDDHDLRAPGAGEASCGARTVAPRRRGGRAGIGWPARSGWHVRLAG